MRPAELAALVGRLKELGAAVATVESCTGGLVAHRITGVAGASEVFWGSLVTYDNSAKVAVAGVPGEILARHGAVSRETAGALAAGGLDAMARALAGRPAGAGGVRGGGPLLCVSTTGVAGPGGGTAEKPVGLCYVAVAWRGPLEGAREEHSVAEVRAAPGQDRERNQIEFAEAALAELGRRIQNPTSKETLP